MRCCFLGSAAQKAEAEEVAALIAAAKATPKGEKKELPGAMCKAYHPQMVETGWCARPALPLQAAGMLAQPHCTLHRTTAAQPSMGRQSLDRPSRAA